MATKAFITPKLITWARQRYGLEIEDAAEKIGVQAATLDAWEKNIARPSLKQAAALAKKFSIPFGFLYLSEPPVERLPLPDLRTVAGAERQKPSPDFLEVLYDALRKQQWYREYLQSEESQEVLFVGSFARGHPVEVVAEDIRRNLRINQDLRDRAKSWEQFLTELIRRTEDVGVLVLRSGIVGNNTHRPLNVEEFRGFVISDEIAPLIFLNSKDAKAAQIFTLIHEIAHLWIGESGISNPDYSKGSKDQHNEIERYCDAVAAEVLVPSRDFAGRWNDSLTLDASIAAMGRQYRVSSFVVLRRAFDLGFVPEDVYWAKVRELLSDSRAPGNGTGGNYYTNVMARNSPRFTGALMAAAAEGRVSYLEAASLLNVANLKSLQNIEAHVLSRGLSSA